MSIEVVIRVFCVNVLVINIIVGVLIFIYILKGKKNYWRKLVISCILYIY